MSTFHKDRLMLVSQGINGKGQLWQYWDTGSISDVADVAGYFTSAGDMGVDSGAMIMISANNGYTNRLVFGAAFCVVQDTGATQGSLGPSTTIGDTG